MTTKFSNGPWQVVRWSETEDGEQPEKTGDCFVRTKNYDLCYLAINTTDDEDETEADAHLIAAAPDMYGILEKIQGYNAEENEDKPLIDNDAIWQAIDKALAKARGES